MSSTLAKDASITKLVVNPHAPNLAREGKPKAKSKKKLFTNRQPAVKYQVI
jgi:hypothetical protein